jgi:hypothetical protein
MHNVSAGSGDQGNAGLHLCLAIVGLALGAASLLLSDRLSPAAQLFAPITLVGGLRELHRYVSILDSRSAAAAVAREMGKGEEGDASARAR